MNLEDLKEGDKAILAKLDVSESVKKSLLLHGVCLGSLVQKNYSPSYAKLCNITVKSKMLSLRSIDAMRIEVVKYFEK